MSNRSPSAPRDVVLIHGLFLSWSSWDQWVERYAAQGFNVLAPAWPGLEGSVETLRSDPTPFTRLNVQIVLDHFDKLVRSLDSAPIIVGHSFGGLIAQLLAYRGLAAAVVGIDSTAPAGVLTLPFSTLKASAPILANPLNIGKATMLSAKQFHYAFTNTLSEEESDVLYERYAVPCANRVLFEGAFENFVPRSPARVHVKSRRCPMLLIAGGEDHLVTTGYTRSNFELISQSPDLTALKVFHGRPHFTGAVPGWEEVADYALKWALKPVAMAHARVSDEIPSVTRFEEAEIENVARDFQQIIHMSNASAREAAEDVVLPGVPSPSSHRVEEERIHKANAAGKKEKDLPVGRSS